MGQSEGREAGFLSVLSRVVLGLLRREVNDTVRMVETEGPQSALGALVRLAREVWTPRWADSVSEPLAAIMEDAPLQTDRGPVRLGFDTSNPLTAEFLEGYVSRLGRDLSETSRQNAGRVIQEAMDEGLSNQDTARRLQERLPEINRARAELIAANETHRAAVSASEFQARKSGVIGSRTWLSASDDRVRPAHRLLNGATVGMDEPFPGDIHSPADEVRCRCVLLYNVSPEALTNSAQSA